MSIKETIEFLEGKGPKLAGKSKSIKPPPETKKRVHYKERECPYCHIHVRNLGNHVKQKHPAAPGESPPPPAPVELTKEALLGTGPKEVSIGHEIYYCSDCKAELRKGENPCWHCGATMNWEGL